MPGPGLKTNEKKVKQAIKQVVKQDVKRIVAPKRKQAARPAPQYNAKLNNRRGFLPSGVANGRNIASMHQKLAGKLRGYIRSGLKNEVTRIMESQMLPFSSEVVRFSGEFSNKNTSVAKPFLNVPVPWTSGATLTATQALPATDWFLAMFRDPRRAYITYDPNLSALGWNYTCLFGNNPGPTSPAAAMNIGINGLVDWGISYATANGTYQPHGPVLWAATDGSDDDLDSTSRNYIWIDSAAVGTTTVTFSGFPATNSTNYSAAVYLYRSGQAYTLQSTTITTTASGTWVFTLANNLSGYYSFAFSCNSNAVPRFCTGVVIDSGATRASVIAHKMLPGYFNNMSVINRLRTLSYSFMYTNTAASGYREGKITGQQANSGGDWMSLVGFPRDAGTASGGYQNISNNATAGQSSWMDITKGFYGFAKIDSVKCFDNVVEPDTTGRYPGPYPLTPDTDFIIMYAVVANPGSTQVSYQDAYYTCGWQVEYETDDQWRSTQYPNVRPADYIEAYFEMTRNGGCPQFHENPLHFSDILSWIKNKALPAVSKGLAMGASMGGDPRISGAMGLGSAIAGAISQY